jgi:predicted RNA-binding protein with PUA-like domain
MAVKLVPSKSLPKPLNLEQIKSDDLLSGMVLLKQSRLSVMPLEKLQFEHIIKITS